MFPVERFQTRKVLQSFNVGFYFFTHIIFPPQRKVESKRFQSSQILEGLNKTTKIHDRNPITARGKPLFRKLV